MTILVCEALSDLNGQQCPESTDNVYVTECPHGHRRLHALCRDHAHGPLLNYAHCAQCHTHYCALDVTVASPISDGYILSKGSGKGQRPHVARRQVVPHGPIGEGSVYTGRLHTDLSMGLPHVHTGRTMGSGGSTPHAVSGVRPRSPGTTPTGAPGTGSGRRAYCTPNRKGRR